MKVSALECGGPGLTSNETNQLMKLAGYFRKKDFNLT